MVPDGRTPHDGPDGPSHRPRRNAASLCLASLPPADLAGGLVEPGGDAALPVLVEVRLQDHAIAAGRHGGCGLPPAKMADRKRARLPRCAPEVQRQLREDGGAGKGSGRLQLARTQDGGALKGPAPPSRGLGIKARGG